MAKTAKAGGSKRGAERARLVIVTDPRDVGALAKRLPARDGWVVVHVGSVVVHGSRSPALNTYHLAEDAKVCECGSELFYRRGNEDYCGHCDLLLED